MCVTRVPRSDEKLVRSLSLGITAILLLLSVHLEFCVFSLVLFNVLARWNIHRCRRSRLEDLDQQALFLKFPLLKCCCCSLGPSLFLALSQGLCLELQRSFSHSSLFDSISLPLFFLTCTHTHAQPEGRGRRFFFSLKKRRVSQSPLPGVARLIRLYSSARNADTCRFC